MRPVLTNCRLSVILASSETGHNNEMRRRTDQPEVGFTARIPATLKQGVDDILPMTGGKRWLIETALDEFLSICSRSPKLVEWVNDQVMQMREDGRPRERLVDFLPRVNTELYKKFNDIFPQKGATTWFIRTYLAQFLRDADELASMEDAARSSAKSMLRPALPSTIDPKVSELLKPGLAEAMRNSMKD